MKISAPLLHFRASSPMYCVKKFEFCVRGTLQLVSRLPPADFFENWGNRVPQPLVRSPSSQPPVLVAIFQLVQGITDFQILMIGENKKKY
jgi:hypothetical protein